jgi:hypothetical protein
MKTVSKIALLAILIAISFTPHLQAQDFEAIGKRLVTQLAARQFDQVEAQFDDQMKAALPVSKLPDTWDSLLAQVGAFKSIVSAQKVHSGAFWTGASKDSNSQKKAG